MNIKNLFKRTTKIKISPLDTVVPVTSAVETAGFALNEFINENVHLGNKDLNSAATHLIPINNKNLLKAISDVCNDCSTITLGDYQVLMYNYGVLTSLRHLDFKK